MSRDLATPKGRNAALPYFMALIWSMMNMIFFSLSEGPNAGHTVYERPGL
jgi:hypothetical protein